MCVFSVRLVFDLCCRLLDFKTTAIEKGHYNMIRPLSCLSDAICMTYMLNSLTPFVITDFSFHRSNLNWKYHNCV